MSQVQDMEGLISDSCIAESRSTALPLHLLLLALEGSFCMAILQGSFHACDLTALGTLTSGLG